jgi:hypothetical protein
LQPKVKIETLVNEIIKQTENDILRRSNKLQSFICEFNKQFKKSSMDILYNDIIRMIFKGIKGALVLYALNLNGQVLIELAGILVKCKPVSVPPFPEIR